MADATGRELVFQRRGGRISLREESALVTLNAVRRQGHPYVELRRDGKRSIFFCTLCLSRCYSDFVLFDHLNGNLHRQRYAAAKATLLKPNPWPFDDGVFFFHYVHEEEREPLGSKLQTDELLRDFNESGSNEDSLDSHDYDKALDKISSHVGDILEVVFPGVMINEVISVLHVKTIGYGHIAVRVRETDNVSSKVCKIWCTWFGEKDTDDGDFIEAPESDFSIITFSYTNDLGRIPHGTASDLSLPASSPSYMEVDSSSGSGMKRKESLSDSEDMHELTADCSGSDSAENRPILSKSARRELRQQKRVASDRMCGMCQQKMLLGKDVSTLLNKNTGNIACSSRNFNGAFHVFHTSCLLNWLLLCDCEMMTTDRSINAGNLHGDTAAKPRGRKAAKTGKVQSRSSGREPSKPFITSPFCPECQGTGINIEDELERPRIPLSKMFQYKINISESHNLWMQNPENLEKCSTGLYFPSSSEEEIQERVVSLKKLTFYRAVE